MKNETLRKTTMIRVSPRLKLELLAVGKNNETFEDIIWRMIKRRRK